MFKKFNTGRILAAVRVGIITGLREMKIHKLRSFLSLLGVMLGVGALVAMLSIVGGVDDFMKSEMGSMAGRVGLSGARMPEDRKEQLVWSRSPGFRFSDLDFLESLKEVSRVFRTVSRGEKIRLGRKLRRIRLLGTNRENLAAETNVVLQEGRFFKEEEYAAGISVCVVSWLIKERMQNKSNRGEQGSVVGKSLSFSGKRFRIIGVFGLKNKKFRQWHYRYLVYMPLHTMQRYISGFNTNPGFAMLELSDIKNIDKQITQVGEKLARHHRSVEDFEFHIFDFVKEFKRLLSNIKTLFGIIAVASLLVGGLGIMNVMLSSLSERIHEIGVRKALGASVEQVFIQFITETVVLSLTGGLAGAIIGCLPVFFSEAIYKAGGELIKPQLETSYVLFVFIVVVTLGVFFGMYPAVKASRLNPVEALRYE